MPFASCSRKMGNPSMAGGRRKTTRLNLSAGQSQYCSVGRWANSSIPSGRTSGVAIGHAGLVQSLKFSRSVFRPSACIGPTPDCVTPGLQRGHLHRHTPRMIAGRAELGQAPLCKGQPFGMSRLELLCVRRECSQLIPLSVFVPCDTDHPVHEPSLIMQSGVLFRVQAHHRATRWWGGHVAVGRMAEDGLGKLFDTGLRQVDQHGWPGIIQPARNPEEDRQGGAESYRETRCTSIVQ